MQAFEELKKKIRDIETQSLAMDGCSPSFSVNDILSIIDSVGKDIDVTTTDTISRQAAIDALHDEIVSRRICEDTNDDGALDEFDTEAILRRLPSAQPEPHEIGYPECANAMLKMWIDNVLTDGEYSRIMDKLNACWAERREG